MKKLFLTTIPMQQKSFNAVYSVKNASNISYEKPVYYPITCTLAENISAGDNVKLCVIKVEDHDNPDSEEKFALYYDYLKNEVDEICKQAKANISYQIITTNFIETKDVFGQQFMQLFDVIEEDMKIYADITFGPKPFTMITLNMLYFAEQFYNADIEAIVYGKASFINGVPDPNTSRICDISALYYLNNITANMEAENGQEAKELLSRFFGL